jgi:hypothetical protein
MLTGHTYCHNFQEYKLAIKEELLHTLTITFLKFTKKLMVQYLTSTTKIQTMA